ncbi:MAG: amino acid permease [Gemmatimonadetes bacterium]|nr:amino acid permease [Gemmatimonadota bacterium]MBI3569114.1 amino acid permease [Gemmatimonadota bacterium]
MPTPGSDTGSPERALERSLGVRALAASIVNVTVGGGIFIVPAIVATNLGAAAPLAYLVCAVAFGLIVACFAEAGSRIALTGGPYMYVERVFGPFVGYVSNVLLWMLSTIAHAAVASLFAQALNALVPGMGVGLARAAVIIGVFGLFAFINARGVRQGARVIEVATAAKLLPLLLFVGTGLFAMKASNLVWPAMPSVAAVGRTSIILVFAFSGIESALVPSGEVKEPSRTVPRAILLAMVLVTVLYIVVQVVAQGVLGAELPSHPDAPLATAATRVIGPAGGLILMVGAAVSMAGYLSGMMLAAPRSLYAFARDGYLPRALAKVDPRTHVPAAAIYAHATVVTLLGLSGTFEKLAVLSNISALLLYGLCSVAAFELRRRNVQEGGTPFRVPFGTVIPWLSVLVILFLLSNATAAELRAVGGTVAVAAVLYLFRRKGDAPA